ncbi:hypothetical protein FKW77_002538 [Venturia effusa]|uniref:TATA element modulatory factor 1 TATA binding domain-containing protein n=1 Tax=Venturia effusa TaxID=50376 RepID=A0A517LF02_9PEZI|nr:hypothetical protein FKW77_002538 [Venturia effusa]
MAAPQKQGSRWGLGSLVSGAVAGLESRLDTILADDETRAAEEAARKAKAAASRPAVLKADTPDASRTSSRNRANDRLAEKLAKRETARAAGTRTPIETASPRPSITISRDSGEAKQEDVSTETKGQEIVEEDGRKSIAADSTLPQMRPDEATATDAMETNTKPSLEVRNSVSARASTDILSTRPSNDSLSVHEPPIQEKPILRRSPSFLESELARITKTQDENTRNYQEELHAHLERIDALQSKLVYLASQTSAAAREAASSAPSGSTEKKLAEQEEKIAQLLEEGQKLSKTEMKHMTAIKKLRQRIQEEEKEKFELKRRLQKTEQEWIDQRDRLRILEERDKAAQERLKSLPKIEQEVDILKRDKETSDREVSELKKQLVESERRAEDAEKRAQTDKLEDQMRVVAELNDELSNARIEKKLVEDRGKAEVKKVQEEAARQADKAKQLESELRNDVQNLETKLELLRSKSEESTSTTTTSDQTKLLRQVETLQTQYALASENWQALESSLTSRITTLEKERDEVAKREADMRKKAREVNAKSRRLEEELEAEKDEKTAFETQIATLTTSLKKLQARVEAAEKTAEESRSELEKERKSLQTRLEEEKTKWRLESLANASGPPTPSESNHFLRADHPFSNQNRKTSTPDLSGLHISNHGHGRRSNVGSRIVSSDRDLPPLHTDSRPSSSRRTSIQPFHHPGMSHRTTADSTTPSRHEFSPHERNWANGSVPPSAAISVAPSIDIDDIDRDRESMGSPHRTVNELISVSAAGAGPSVQLVERMSAAVRRLESEKATNKEELMRIQGQRDEARSEVVALMREVEALKRSSEKVAQLEEEIKEVKGKFEASLEMLGEKSEEAEELRNDVQDLKKLYRELVDSTLK